VITVDPPETCSTNNFFELLDGSGESFLFRFNPDNNMIEQYRWTGENDFIVLSTTKSIGMGGGGKGFGFILDQDFETGESSSCSTFNNPPLTKSENTVKVLNVECWGFEGFISSL
jgi:hypothetical protein